MEDENDSPDRVKIAEGIFKEIKKLSLVFNEYKLYQFAGAGQTDEYGDYYDKKIKLSSEEEFKKHKPYKYVRRLYVDVSEENPSEPCELKAQELVEKLRESIIRDFELYKYSPKEFHQVAGRLILAIVNLNKILNRSNIGWKFSDYKKFSEELLSIHTAGLDSLRSINLYASSTTDNSSPIHYTQSGSVILFPQDEKPLVNQTPKKCLTIKQYMAVAALIRAGEKGLSKKQLDEEAKISDARTILRRLISDPDWKLVIIFPGTANSGGYRIR